MALGHDPSVGIENRHFIRTVPRTVLASDTDIVIMKDDPIVEFYIRFGRAAPQTLGIDAVVAAHRIEELECIGKCPHLHLSNPSPLDFGRIVVLLIAGDFTAVTADTGCRIEVEAILLTGLELGDIYTVVTALHPGIIFVIDEAFERSMFAERFHQTSSSAILFSIRRSECPHSDITISAIAHCVGVRRLRPTNTGSVKLLDNAILKPP
jgi:hypothetical protein